jgi:hypothetical protein
MESDMDTITEHVTRLEKFYSEQGDKLSSLAIQDRRIQFSRGRLETEKLKASKQEWQDVKGYFESYHGQVSSPPLRISALNRSTYNLWRSKVFNSARK